MISSFLDFHRHKGFAEGEEDHGEEAAGVVEVVVEEGDLAASAVVRLEVEGRVGSGNIRVKEKREECRVQRYFFKTILYSLLTILFFSGTLLHDLWFILCVGFSFSFLRL